MAPLLTTPAPHCQMNNCMQNEPTIGHLLVNLGFGAPDFQIFDLLYLLFATYVLKSLVVTYRGKKDKGVLEV